MRKEKSFGGFSYFWVPEQEWEGNYLVKRKEANAKENLYLSIFFITLAIAAFVFFSGYSKLMDSTKEPIAGLKELKELEIKNNELEIQKLQIQTNNYEKAIGGGSE